MNRFGDMLRQVESAADAADRKRILYAYLDRLPQDDLEAVAIFLSPQPGPCFFPSRKLRSLLEQHWSRELFSLSHAFVGNLAETIALLWPIAPGSNRPVTPAELALGLRTTGQMELQQKIGHWLSGTDAAGRHAIVRILTGTLRNPLPAELFDALFPFKGVCLQPTIQKQAHQTQGELFTPLSTVGESPGEIDAALMYVERPRARQQGLLCTFGLWSGNGLVPVARLQAGDFAPIVEAFLAQHATRRFGPTHEVRHDVSTAFIATIGFDGVAGSNRNRAGITLQSPRLVSVTTPATVHDADDIASLTSRLPTPIAHG